MPHAPQDTHPLHYRADIDGLRAIAVLSVVGFHAFPTWVQGGFIGVDIFFVISGFLISSIIFSNLEKNQFSIARFYEKRIRRIFPSLVVVMLACLVFGWFALLQDEYKQLNKHLVGGVGFVSNLMLWKESNYFDNVGDTKPLLHLWSLAVEEQFYIFWPLLLACVWKRRWSFLSISCAIALLSFGANIYYVHSAPEAAFYLPTSRFWELMAGGILAYTGLHHPSFIARYANTQSVAGLVLLACGLAFIHKSHSFPGWWALLPTAGAVLLIAGGPTTWVNRHLMAHKVLVWFGLISYPLYLWHWSLLSFARVLEMDTPEVKLAAVMLAVLLAWLTYRWIEKPLRFGTHGRTKTGLLLASMLAIGGAAATIYAHNGVARDTSKAADRMAFYRYFLNIPNGRLTTVFEQHFRPECSFSDSAREIAGDKEPKAAIDPSCYQPNRARYRKFVLVWGDSHAEMLNYGLAKNMPADWQVLQIATSGCRPSINGENTAARLSCSRSNTLALETVAQVRPDVVVVAQRAGHSVALAQEMARTLHTLGAGQVVFTGPTPEWTSDLPKLIVRKLWVDTPQRSLVGLDTAVFQADTALHSAFAQAGLHYVSLTDTFCNPTGCQLYFGDDKKSGITSWDYGHLSPAASDFLARSTLIPAITGSVAIK